MVRICHHPKRSKPMETLFDLPEPEEVLPKRIEDMYALFGKTPNETCGTCNNLIRYSQAATWFKCSLARQSASAATDWRMKWDACGKWEPSPCGL